MQISIAPGSNRGWHLMIFFSIPGFLNKTGFTVRLLLSLALLGLPSPPLRWLNDRKYNNIILLTHFHISHFRSRTSSFETKFLYLLHLSRVITYYVSHRYDISSHLTQFPTRQAHFGPIFCQILIEKHICRFHPRPIWPLGQLSDVQSPYFFMLINVVSVLFWSGPWG